MNLDKKIVLLTGSNGLIGKATAKHLKSNGAIVIGADIIGSTEVLDKFIETDLTSSSCIDTLVSDILQIYGRIDGLINLAYPRTKDWGDKFEDIQLESWRINLDMQLNLVFYLCQKVLDIMKIQNSGSIVNVASIYGIVGNDFSIYEDYGGTSPAAYSAIKGGLINFTRYLASYYGKYNIRVNCMSPGGVLDIKNQHPSFIKNYSQKSPLKRLGNPEEMAPAISFLISDDSSYITGHNLVVDGGWTAI